MLSHDCRPIGSGRNTGARVLIRPTREKKGRDRLIALALGHPEWILGFQDEVWWSRLAQPHLQTWTDDTPLRLLQNEPDRHAPAPKAVACYGLLRADTQGMLLRFVDGRPVRAVTTQFLAWLTDRLAAEGKTALLLVWDNASWHVSQAVRTGRKAHNRRGKREGGCRVVMSPLPIKSPWLNRIEPKWVHGKRAIAEPDRKLGVDELRHRICAYDDCELLEPITQYVSWSCTRQPGRKGRRRHCPFGMTRYAAPPLANAQDA